MLGRIIAAVLFVLGLFLLFAWSQELPILGMIAVLFLLFLVGIVCSFIIYLRMRISLEIKNSTMENKNLRVIVHVNNRTVLPVLKGRIRLHVENLSFGVKDTITKSFSLKSGEQDLEYDIACDYCGKFLVTVDYFRIYDFWGMTFHSFLKRRQDTVYMFPEYTYINSVHQVQRVNYEKEKMFSHRKSMNLSEILQYREYQPGDSLRHINWKLSDRYNQLLVREFDTPTDNQMLVTFDAFNTDKRLKSLVYSTLMSISASCVERKITHQVGWYGMFPEKNNGTKYEKRIIELYDFHSVFQTIQEILDASSDKDHPQVLALVKDHTLEKYARVIYVTNNLTEGVRKELVAYDNVKIIEIGGESFRGDKALRSISALDI